MDNVVKQTELLEKTGVYDEDLKRRFSLTLKYNGIKGKKILVIGMNPASNNVQVFDNTTWIPPRLKTAPVNGASCLLVHVSVRRPHIRRNLPPDGGV